MTANASIGFALLIDPLKASPLHQFTLWLRNRFAVRDEKLAKAPEGIAAGLTPLREGEWRLLSREGDALAFERRNGDNRIFVVLNLPLIRRPGPPPHRRRDLHTWRPSQ